MGPREHSRTPSALRGWSGQILSSIPFIPDCQDEAPGERLGRTRSKPAAGGALLGREHEESAGGGGGGGRGRGCAL